MLGMLDSGPGINALLTPASVINTIANQAGKRHRGVTTRPVGKSSGTKMTSSALVGIQSQPAVSQAIARPAGKAPWPPVSANAAYTDPAKFKVTRPPTSVKTQPNAFPGWRETTSAPISERDSAHTMG